MTCKDCIWCREAKLTNVYYCQLEYLNYMEIIPLDLKNICIDFDHRDYPKDITIR